MHKKTRTISNIQIYELITTTKNYNNVCIKITISLMIKIFFREFIIIIYLKIVKIIIFNQFN